MANDRMYIRCTVCGKSMMLAKHFGSPWYTPEWGDGITIGDMLDEFFIEHYPCIPEKFRNDILCCMKRGMHYELKFEEEDDYGEWAKDIVPWREIRENIKKKREEEEE